MLHRHIRLWLYVLTIKKKQDREPAKDGRKWCTNKERQPEKAKEWEPVVHDTITLLYALNIYGTRQHLQYYSLKETRNPDLHLNISIGKLHLVQSWCGSFGPVLIITVGVISAMPRRITLVSGSKHSKPRQPVNEAQIGLISQSSTVSWSCQNDDGGFGDI